MARKAPENLSKKQEQFCVEYLVDMNASQAAIRAGYSKKTAGSQGCCLLKNPKVKARLDELTKHLQLDTTVTIERVVKEIASVAFGPSKHQDKLKALDMLMKHLGGYDADNKMDVTTSGKAEVVIYLPEKDDEQTGAA